jgi:hypothetical protein
MALTALQMKKADDGMLDGGKVHFRSGWRQTTGDHECVIMQAGTFPVLDGVRRHVMSEDKGVYSVVCSDIYVYQATSKRL